MSKIDVAGVIDDQDPIDFEFDNADESEVGDLGFGWDY